MIFKQIANNVFEEIEWTPKAKYNWEEIPQEELYEDGELSTSEVQDKIINHVLNKGDWIVVRRIDT